MNSVVLKSRHEVRMCMSTYVYIHQKFFLGVSMDILLISNVHWH